MPSVEQSQQVTLDDKWVIQRGRILLSGTQAIARALIQQAQHDRRCGLDTAGFISGYRGSPLGNVDSTLWAIEDRLAEAAIRFAPGLNEDLAATAVRGTQQLDSVPGALKQGVFAAWYGKGPGVDRSIDALKHGNYGGSHRNGGVLAYYGDDHGGKSSSIAHHSEQAMASAMIPSLYPADVGEIIEYSRLGYALSRYSGSWVGIKCVNEVVEQTSSVDVDADSFDPILPPTGPLPPEGLHARKGPFGPLREEQIVSDYRIPLVKRFVRENGIDKVVFAAAERKLGLVTAGKSYSDTREALDLLGLDKLRAEALGLSLYKVGCIWPLEPEGVVAFARDHETLFVIEEKKSFLEAQAAEVLINIPASPRVIGKRDETGAALLSAALQLEPVGIALAIAARLDALGISDAALRAACDALRSRAGALAVPKPTGARFPYFCSGCPHNRSTRVPEGSLSMTGIGCHTMVSFVRPDQALLPTHMGGEGANWIGLAPFTSTPHIFQNMGDGTYYHSGLLAIRAAIASGVNITFKILYNDAVAMTGGQPVDGPISVAQIAQQVRHEGVTTIVVASDNPDHHRADGRLPSGVRIIHRDDLDSAQRDLRQEPGCSVLIYEQTCAAEKRRRRKRGFYPDPPRRLFIAEAVCEGCGDCSVQSTCVSLMPVETEHGTKRRIDQSSCNKDYSCLNGFCPSFLTIDGAQPSRRASAEVNSVALGTLAPPARLEIPAGSFNVMLAGIGGTGVVTVGAIMAMAAHIEGLAVSTFDMTGLAQKNGAVYSHIRFARRTNDLGSQKLAQGQADLLIAFDMVAALGVEAASTLNASRSGIIANCDVVPTAAFQFDRDAAAVSPPLIEALQSRVDPDALHIVHASTIAQNLLGDAVGANLFMVGLAVQRGLLPIGVAATEQAIRLNGTAMQLNLTAFSLGRLFAADRDTLEAMLPRPAAQATESLGDVIARSAERLTQYQDVAYAARFRNRIAEIQQAEERAAPGSTRLTMAVAANYSKLMAYKDEYEVARLLSDPKIRAEIDRAFVGKPSISFNLAPPILAGKPVNGRPGKRRIPARVALPLFRALAAFKRLRGTPLDIFGYAQERRTERALVAEYEDMLDKVITRLDAGNLDLAVHLLSLPNAIRGFGPVKEEAIARYHALRVEALQRFLSSVANEDLALLGRVHKKMTWGRHDSDAA